MTRKPARILRRNTALQRKALVLAIGGTIALAFGPGAFAQAINGTIRGTVPVAPNEAIQITGGSGFNRTISVSESGKYAITLPVGTYTVSLLQNGKVVESQTGVTPVAAGSVSVNFSTTAQNVQSLSTITVSANTVPPIDITNTRQVTTITAQQLEQLPLERSAAAIALLSPGVRTADNNLYGGALGTPMVSFGGAGPAENAYYIDGMNTTYQLVNQGGITLPYGAIAQQQTFISGYGAKYGRSIGGVINQIGKGGTNEWHFGVRAVFEPGSWHAKRENTYWANPLYTGPTDAKAGNLLVYNQASRSQTHIYDAYVSGPIWKDHLFFFLALEKNNTIGQSVGSILGQTMTYYQDHDPKTYLKLNWNINDSNVLSVSMLQMQLKSWSTTNQYDYNTFKAGDFMRQNNGYKTSFLTWVANYTSYITDDLTLHAMFGKQHGEYYVVAPSYPGYDPTVAPILGAASQDPAMTPGGLPVYSPNPTSLALFNEHQSRIMNYRVHLDYRLGNHDISLGIDNINIWDNNDGSRHSGPGYAWKYGHTDPNTDIFAGDPNVAPWAGPPISNGPNTSGGDGYYVAKQHVLNVASVFSSQRAQYIEDRWQVTPTLLLDLGLRNSQFTNYNAFHVPYIRLTKPQWSPRLGFSWDVHGDSTLKIFGNAGRYYLAMPSKSALWVGTKQKLINLYGTYTGIDPVTGAPIGFKPVPQNPSTGVSPNNQYGNTQTNPKLVTAKNIQAEYSDNFVLGLKQQFHMLGNTWVFGATASLQRLGRVINKYGDIQRECSAARAQGLDFMTPADCGQYTQSILLINPGEKAIVRVPDPSGQIHSFNLTAADQGYVHTPKRKYFSLDLSLQHVWDGKWFARADYIFSKQYGTDEGPVSAQHNQAGSYDSINASWQFPEFSEGANGYLPGDHRHAVKLYGAVALTPEWTVGGNIRILSGQPKMCVGAYGPDQVYLHGFGSYHWCAGKMTPGGSQGRYPWSRQLDLSVTYRPAWADHKLDMKFAVFNVFDEQTVTSRYQYFGTTEFPSRFYNYVQARQPPRYMRFSIAYNY